jgi:hypothetical protein
MSHMSYNNKKAARSPLLCDRSMVPPPGPLDLGVQGQPPPLRGKLDDGVGVGESLRQSPHGSLQRLRRVGRQQPARAFPSSIDKSSIDKSRRDIGKSQSKWTASKMETPGSQRVREQRDDGKTNADQHSGDGSSGRRDGV